MMMIKNAAYFLLSWSPDQHIRMSSLAVPHLDHRRQPDRPTGLNDHLGVHVQEAHGGDDLLLADLTRYKYHKGWGSMNSTA